MFQRPELILILIPSKYTTYDLTNSIMIPIEKIMNCNEIINNHNRAHTIGTNSWEIIKKNKTQKLAIYLGNTQNADARATPDLCCTLLINTKFRLSSILINFNFITMQYEGCGYKRKVVIDTTRLFQLRIKYHCSRDSRPSLMQY